MSRELQLRRLDDFTKLEVAQLLEVVARSKHPKLDLGTIAVNHKLALADLHRLIRQHGYPDQARLRRAGLRLLDEAVLEPEPAPSGDGRPLMLPIGKVLPDPNNPREELHGLEDLAASMTGVGMLEPIVVRRRGESYVIVAGHRRRAAAALLGQTEVPVVIADLRPDDVLVAMLIENGQREDLDPVEEARALERIRRERAADPDAPLSHSELAALIGRSQPYVSTRLALLALSPEDQAAVRAGHLALRDAVTIGRNNAGTTRVGAHGKKSAAHFDSFHPLAPAARVLCRQNGHHKNTSGGKIGGVACGHCWEAAIRGDEAMKVERRLGSARPDVATSASGATVTGSTTEEEVAS